MLTTGCNKVITVMKTTANAHTGQNRYGQSMTAKIETKAYRSYRNVAYSEQNYMDWFLEQRNHDKVKALIRVWLKIEP